MSPPGWSRRRATSLRRSGLRMIVVGFHGVSSDPERVPDTTYFWARLIHSANGPERSGQTAAPDRYVLRPSSTAPLRSANWFMAAQTSESLYGTDQPP